MAKIGLNYGEKLQIADKTYRVITDGLNVPEVLGKLSFRGIEGPDIIFEEDRTQRNPDGSFVQVNTGEIRGIVVAIHSSVQHETLFFTIADMAQSEIEDLALNTEKKLNLKISSLPIRTLTVMIFTSSLLLKSRKRMEGHLLRKTNL